MRYLLMTQVQTFQKDGKELRVVVQNDEALIIFKDYCSLSGISNHADALKRVSADERITVNVDTGVGVKAVWAVTLDGLEGFARRSHKVNSTKIFDWIIVDVIPNVDFDAIESETEPIKTHGYEHDFVYFDGHNFRQVVVEGEPRLILMDVCQYLGIVNHRDVATRIPTQFVLNVGITDANLEQGRKVTTMITVNAEGVRRVIETSHKPKAIKLAELMNKKPEPQAALPDPEREALTTKVHELETYIADKMLLINYAETVMPRVEEVLIEVLANMLTARGYFIQTQAIYADMRDNGWLIKRRGASWNLPTKKSTKRGYMVVVESERERHDNSGKHYLTTRLTATGVAYFLNYFMKKIDKERARKRLAE